MSFRPSSLTVLLFVVNFFAPAAQPNDGATLLEMKKSFKNADKILYNWKNSSSLDYCFWRGVMCDSLTSRVITLNMSGLHLDGEISPAIGDLKGLITIDLSGNQLTGQIPDEIGDCLSLHFLDLSANNIHGAIPSSISKLKKLETLCLNTNQLNGPIPLPIPKLIYLNLAQNKLSGEIPNQIYWNVGLKYLELRDNKLEGTLSPDMCQLTRLRFFDLRNNSLTGAIPNSIGNCTSFKILDLAYNHLTGEIPSNVWFLKVGSLFLQGNNFSGKIPDAIGLNQDLGMLDLSCNQLSGSIPPHLGNLTYATHLHLQSNKLTGPIPPELGNLTNLNYLKLSDNQLTGQIPLELGKLTKLFDMNLANNRLEGTIPDNLSYCSNLTRLSVHGNKLFGTIPRALEKLKRMTYLNLSSNSISGSIPIELSKISNLDTLDISCNNISGPIPSSVGDLEHLLKLNLSNNHICGYIPAELGNLRSIMEIDLSSNELSGAIPQELGLQQNLMTLNLQKNKLSGDIASLTSIGSLVSLNVSYNNFAGDIPCLNFTQFPPESFIGNPGLRGYKLGSRCNHLQGQRSPISKAVILIIVFGALLVLLVCALLVACRPHNPAPSADIAMEEPVPPKLVILHMNMACRVYEDIMRMTENLSEKYIIGYGGSSTVYKCIIPNCRPVAIKRLPSHYPHCLKEFERVLETVGSIKHRNLVSLQGYSLSLNGNLLFYDYMENGSLWDLLHDPTKKKNLVWATRVGIALGAAQGLAYLHHDCCPPIIHRNVKSSNILLDKDLEPHLTDFGTAKILCGSKGHTSTEVIGTVGYIDPEYAGTSRLNDKSDVYSYGIVLLELLTGRKAVEDGCNLHHWILSRPKTDTVMGIVDPDILSDTGCVDDLVKELLDLALQCTKKEPCDRPTMCVVVQELQWLMGPTMQPRMTLCLSSSRYGAHYGY